MGHQGNQSYKFLEKSLYHCSYLLKPKDFQQESYLITFTDHLVSICDVQGTSKETHTNSFVEICFSDFSDSTIVTIHVF
jgi:hypothetical protein